MFKWWYEVEEADDGSSYIVMFIHTDYAARRRIGPIAMRFAQDMRIAADDWCRSLNENREVTKETEKLFKNQCLIPEKQTPALATPQ